MYKLEAIVKSKNGVHARPSGMIVECVKKHKTKITLENPIDHVCADGASIMSLLQLGVECGETVIITGEGPDEQETVELVAKILREFDI